MTRVENGTPALAYHDIEICFRLGSLNPSAAQFESQVRFLKEKGYRSVSLDEVVRDGGEGRAVALTFDDGYEGVHRYALPVLVKYGFTGTVFVVTGFVGRRSLWDLNLRWLGGRHMDWSAVRDLARAGLTIGSHTVTHPDLVHLDDRRVRGELVDSKRRLEDALGAPVDRLSYPFGRYDARVKDAATAAGYRLACTIRPRRGEDGRDPLALKRLCIRSLDRLSDFRGKVREGGPTRFQDCKEAVLAACNRSSLIARRRYDRREDEGET